MIRRLGRITQQLTDQVFINGEFLSATTLLTAFKPEDGSIFGHYPEVNSSVVDSAVLAAKNAFGSWSQSSGTDRARLMRRIAESVRHNKAMLAEKEAIMSGKPIAEAEWDVDDVAGCFEYFAGLAEGLDEKNWTSRKVGDDG